MSNTSEKESAREGWETLTLCLSCGREEAKKRAGEAYLVDDTEEFQKQERERQWWRAWEEHIERLGREFKGGSWPPSESSGGKQAGAEGPRRRMDLRSAEIDGVRMTKPSKVEFYRAVFMLVWKNAGGDIAEAKRLWGGHIYPGDQSQTSGRVFVPEADVTINGTAWKAMQKHIEEAAGLGGLEGHTIRVTVATPEGETHSREWR